MARDIDPIVYILASARNGTLYIGVSSDLCGRVARHKSGDIPGFTKTHGVKLLVYVERHGTMEEAIKRETQMKAWKRAWKIALIERENPTWRDLYEEMCGPEWKQS